MRIRVLLAAVLLVVSVACEDTPPVTPTVPDTDGTGTINATINSVPWTSTPASIVATAVVNPVDSRFTNVTFAGTDATLIGLTCTVRTLGTGTYEVLSGAVTCRVTQGPATWEASDTAVSSDGSVTFTTLTTSRAVGNFAFLAVPAAASSATGTKLTSGNFDLRF